MTRELKPCGTPAAYKRHLNHGETPCDACRAAEARKKRNDPRSRARGRARIRALERLAGMYTEAFAALLAEEKAKEGL